MKNKRSKRKRLERRLVHLREENYPLEEILETEGWLKDMEKMEVDEILVRLR